MNYREYKEYQKYVMNFLDMSLQGLSELKKEPKLIPVMINRKKNEDYLKKVPHKDFLDLSIYFRHVMNDEFYITITHEIAASIGMDADALYAKAMRDLPKINPWITLEPFPGFFALTTKNQMYGAAVLLDTEYIAGMADQLGSDLYILPSSIHEVILQPQSGSDAEKLRCIVAEINNRPNVITEQEVLSDHIYQYSRLTGEVSIAC